MAVDLSYQNDPRWGSFSEQEKSDINKQHFQSDWANNSFDDATLSQVDKALAASYKYKKAQTEDVTAQQQALAGQKQEYSQQDQARNYQQAQQAYRY